MKPGKRMSAVASEYRVLRGAIRCKRKMLVLMKM
jgi:hypothetical protein